MKIRVAHSPDSDDAFMFYALANNKFDTDEIEFENILSDIETLNQKAMKGEYEVSAVSIHAYPYVADKYQMLSSGASMGDGYGPVVVSRKPYRVEDINNLKIAIPGKRTSAYLALSIFAGKFEYEVVPFDQITDKVIAGEFEAGLIIHEGQLTYGTSGLHNIVDLGAWFKEKFKLPLPLGGNVIRRDLPLDVKKKAAYYLKKSIAYSLEHREEALEYALSFARGMDTNLADKFVGMYVNDWTLDYGKKGKEAIQLFLDLAFERSLLPERCSAEFIETPEKL
ncbi:MAG: ABC transporter substrate-binding protein [Bacteroidetes bacterium]|nr:ABC transporter substrate-binding protein [Bacteroidota bacterium]MCL5739023.1 ABC transporter substrate-binding protein [Bacteroidota bacterium]